MPYSDDLGNSLASRRRSPRVAVALDARRIDTTEAHLRVTNLSEGGCLLESLHKETVGHRFALEIEFPNHGWLSLQAETIGLRGGPEFAVRFVEVSDEARRVLRQVVRRLLAEGRLSTDGPDRIGHE